VLNSYINHIDRLSVILSVTYITSPAASLFEHIAELFYTSHPDD